VVIGINFKALKKTRWHEYALRFLLGGLVTAITGWLAERFGPVAGGLFLAFPAIFPASATLLEKHEREKKREAGIGVTVRGRLAAALDARGAVMGAVGGMAFAFVVVRLLPQNSLWVSLFLAIATWLVVSSTLWYVRKHHPWARPDRAR
jgi:MFS family permease